MSRVAIARLVGVFGVHGELKCRATPAGEGALAEGRSYALGPEEGAQRARISKLRRHHDRTLVALEGITSVQSARPLVGCDLYADRDEVALAPDEYLVDDLIGLRLLNESGAVLGSVTAVEHYPAHDCLVIEPGRALVPLVRAFVRAIDLEARTIVMNLPAGLFDPPNGRE